MVISKIDTRLITEINETKPCSLKAVSGNERGHHCIIYRILNYSKELHIPNNACA